MIPEGGDGSTVLIESSAPAVDGQSSLLAGWTLAGLFLFLTIVSSLVMITLCYLLYVDKLNFKGKRFGRSKVTSK